MLTVVLFSGVVLFAQTGSSGAKQGMVLFTQGTVSLPPQGAVEAMVATHMMVLFDVQRATVFGVQMEVAFSLHKTMALAGRGMFSGRFSGRWW